MPYVIVSAVVALSVPVSVYASPNFSTYSATSTYVNLDQMTVASGDIWYIEGTTATSPYYGTHIGRMTTSGTVVSNYDLRTLTGNTGFIAKSLTTGSDGNIWFNGYSGSSSIYTGVLNVTTGTAILYSLTGIGAYGSGIKKIVSAADGNLWYALKDANSGDIRLVYVVPSTGVGTVSTINLGYYANISDTTTDSDGNILITDAYMNRVYRYDFGTNTFTGYNMPTGNSWPTAVTADPDGNIWIYESTPKKIAKLTTGGVFTEYAVPTGVNVDKLAAGPDDAIWFTDPSSTKKIGRITTATGTFSSYTVPTGITALSNIIAGPDNAIWFDGGNKVGRLVVTPDFSTYSATSTYVNLDRMTVAGGDIWYIEGTTATSPYYGTHIGRMTTAGTVVADYNLRTLTGNAGFVATSLTTGADGNVWFNGYSGSGPIYTGVLNITTGSTTLYYLSGIGAYGSGIKKIVSAADGNLWYAIKDANSGDVRLVYVVPSTGVGAVSTINLGYYANISDTTTDSNGNILITDAYMNKVYKYDFGTNTMSGYNMPTANSSPSAVTAGPDGNIWIYESTPNKIAKLTSGGTFTEYALPTGVSAGRFTAGPDDAIWFLAFSSGTKKIGRMTTATGTFSSYAVPAGITTLNNIIAGPDNAIWFDGGKKVGRLGY